MFFDIYLEVDEGISFGWELIEVERFFWFFIFFGLIFGGILGGILVGFLVELVMVFFLLKWEVVLDKDFLFI